MPDKVRMKVTVTFEYEADPDNYISSNALTWAEVDRQSFQEDGQHLVEMLQLFEYDVKVEPIGESNGNA